MAPKATILVHQEIRRTERDLNADSDLKEFVEKKIAEKTREADRIEKIFEEFEDMTKDIGKNRETKE